MSDSDLATIVVVPRETFSRTRLALSTMFAHTRGPFELVYVDGRPPLAVRRHLEEQASSHRFTLLRSRRHLSPNEARNCGFKLVRTKYAVFLGNDVLVTDGWLDALVACAEETGASFVSGITCVGELDAPVVYCAGGESHIAVDHDGRRRVRNVHHFAHRALADVGGEMGRCRSAAATFHCLLVRAEVLKRLGGFDEQLCALEHLDFCLRADTEAGGGWFEPGALVTFLPPPPLAPSDVTYFLLRWSRAWIESSVAHFRQAWQIDENDPGLAGDLRWLDHHRWSGLGRAGRAAGRIGGVVDRVVTQTLVRRHARWRIRPSPTAAAARR